MGEEKREKRIRERIFKSGFDPDLGYTGFDPDLIMVEVKPRPICFGY